MLVVDEGAIGPKLAADLIPGQEFTGTLEQHDQNLKGLRVQLDADSLSAELTGGRVCLEDTEAIAPAWLDFGHDWHLVYPMGVRFGVLLTVRDLRKPIGCSCLHR